MKTFFKVLIFSGIITCILLSVSCKKSTQSNLVGKWDRVYVNDISDTTFFETWEFSADGQLLIDCSGYANYIDTLNYKGVLSYEMNSGNKFIVSNGAVSDHWEIVLRKNNKLRIVHNYGEDLDINQGLDSREFVKE